ncbi:hypothetical protein DF185_04005 [Marinifilum breve]|uniref:LUD domain-containing protein n=1 Tax=Marinifilum breve TaxID=2184082 RepID=A0A2V3ZZU9_9BACT|nr:hypothetical protein DF185_04005 [Marinifilum breve]
MFALTNSPENVIVFVGKNKIVRDIKEAIERIKNVSVP